MSGVAPRTLVVPRTFAGLKNSCMFGSAPCSMSMLTIARPFVVFIGSMDARPPSTRLRRSMANQPPAPSEPPIGRTSTTSKTACCPASSLPGMPNVGAKSSRERI